MKRLALGILLILAAAALTLAASELWWIPGRGAGHREIEIEIPKGYSARATAGALCDVGVVPSSRGLRLAMWWEGIGRNLQAGRYRFPGSLSAWEAVAVLRAGPIRPEEREVTIPEGTDLVEIADLLDSAGIVRRADFLDATRGRDLEGFLFPDTYRFLPGATAEEVISRLCAQWRGVIEPLHAAGPNPGGLSLRDAATLASIVEAEARVREEQPVIAAVFLRRLKKGMRLEADPTVRFATGKRTGPVLYVDLDDPSPYNTYRAFGLPPGPIGSFGAGAFRAVMNPVDTNVLFFVAAEDGSGRHLFTPTLSAHNRARGVAKRNAVHRDATRR